MPPKRRYKSKPLVYNLQFTLCASESRCANLDVERLAQLGFISSTASMPMTAFSFRLVEQTHASWRVTPRALTGYADGLKEYYSRCGTKTFGSNAIDEYRALETCEQDSGDLLVGTVDSFQQGSRVLRANHDQIVPDIFLGEEEVQAMKAEVEASVRPTKKACTESWKAADDGAGSTSSRVVDTGLVACVCRHDVNLKMVNLERSGEKLYYALAILKCISERLPENAKIGVLYDIACNFKHHIEKTKCAYFPIICHPRQLLPKLFKRLEFATSVFHAYAHIWSCQVEFNPRLIPNFGLTDGEGSVRAKARVGEEEARIGAEVRQALAWIEDEKTRITSCQTLWTKIPFLNRSTQLMPSPYSALKMLKRSETARSFYWIAGWSFFSCANVLGPRTTISSMFGSTLAGKFRGLHQRLNATGRSVKKAKHHQLPAHNRSGTRGPMETSGSTTRRGLHRWPQDGEMGSSSDESYGDDFAGQEDEYFSGV
ncbi:BZ3500_MvSof-1268-A1-R1_Chr6-2g08525 [Microbotryum saponariae]|uniref:BZ3500_MvSof-1268-A1-R1_Chr6-2g08525 protein n=1 Tax=Microbotryum saponariae TaxID=289078 RepID=A0A2X0NIN2_9BASI|nr:BZ3500_MvSof-1268-A1-R1_Chr6-2g08525 [Microbotryum saponariae]SDA07802.1 BZ3501_MvSof-1269-A2-R1_Chr6-1g08239 [Microbotryum saponariae]